MTSIATPRRSSLQRVVPLTGLFQGPHEGAGKLAHAACGLLGVGMRTSEKAGWSSHPEPGTDQRLSLDQSLHLSKPPKGKKVG